MRLNHSKKALRLYLGANAESEKLISMGQNGGARPGAGRKPKDEKFKQPIAKAEKKIADRLPWLVDKMMELAEGVHVERLSPTGALVVYQQAPDYRAVAYLLDRIMGKPTDRKEVSGPAGGPIPFNWNATVAEIAHGSDEDIDPPGDDTSVVDGEAVG